MNHEPHPAATVVLSRITTTWPSKILLIKRSAKARFLPGAHVFPGGRVEEHDMALGRILAQDKSYIAQVARYFNKDIPTISSYLAAAVRETLEEVAISIASIKTTTGFLPCDNKTLAELCTKLPPNPPELRAYHLYPISWWVTPKEETQRFDTWFFFSFVGDVCMQTISQTEEASEQIWLAPQEALELYEKKAIFLAPPTRTILERMSQTKSLSEFLSYVDAPLRPIHPFFVEENGQKLLILPGDPLHPEKAALRMPLHTRYQFP